MFTKIMKTILMIFIISSFISNAFAAWGYKGKSTTCVNGICHNSTVKKGCVNGHCGAVRHGHTWYRY